MVHTPWIESTGGPLLLLPEVLLPEWSGTEIPSDREVLATSRWQGSGRGSDYDRACDVADYVGAIPIGWGWGLVLGDEPNPTCWVPHSDGGLLARWVFAPHEIAATEALSQVPDDLPWTAAVEFEAVSSPLRLIDAADTGSDLVLPSLQLDLSSGRYSVSWAEYKPNQSTAFTLVKLSAWS